MPRNRSMSLIPAILLVMACGGDAAAKPAPTVNADSVSKDSSAKAAAVKAGPKVARHVFDTVAAAGARPLVRETYHYQSSPLRDPFRPLIAPVERGPALADLRLVAILYDDRDPSGSIATFRDIGNDRRYTVTSQQRLGRISVVNISASSVKLREDDFGTARDQTYSLRKPGDEKP